MQNGYAGVNTRFLHQDERLMLSKENEMPLVIEAQDATDVNFLQEFLNIHSTKLLADLAKYGAVLLRGFDVASDEDFEKTILSIQGFRGISEAFMSEQGRIHVDQLRYVLHTNSVYKTGGTLYLGGFHSENYYTPDVPSYISFCCLKPSEQGGETGLVNMRKVYAQFDFALKEKLEKNTFFVCKWLVSEVAKRYQISTEIIEEICEHFDLPMVGKGKEKFILLYKPSVFHHPVTKQKSLQINLFELPTLNSEIRKCFINDYAGKAWFWHRFVWRLPISIFKILESTAVMFISLYHAPKESFHILRVKLKTYFANKKIKLPAFDACKVATCFSDQDIKHLAQHIRDYYSSSLWEKGDILLVDNRQVMHAGMPGSGDRLIRAMICNPLEMNYSLTQPGAIDCVNRKTDTIGAYMTLAKTMDDFCFGGSVE